MMSATDSFIQYLSTYLSRPTHYRFNERRRGIPLVPATIDVSFVRSTADDATSSEFKMDALNVSILSAKSRGSMEDILVSLDLIGSDLRVVTENARHVRDLLNAVQYTPENFYGAPYDQVVLDKSPVAYWRLDDTGENIDGVGRRALDVTDNNQIGRYNEFGLTGTTYGHPSLIAGSDNPSALFRSQYDSQFNFQSGVDIRNTTPYGPLNGAPVTAELWFKPTVFQGFQMNLIETGAFALLVTAPAPETNNLPYFALTTLDFPIDPATGQPFIDPDTGEFLPGVANTVLGVPAEIGQTYYIVGQRTSTDLWLYVNGSSTHYNKNDRFLPVGITQIIPYASNFLHYSIGDRLTDGFMDEVAVYTTLHSFDYINQRYALGLDPTAVVSRERMVSWAGNYIDFTMVRNEPRYVHLNATFTISHAR